MGIDLDVDLRDEFTWLTKQLFVYVTVEFETAANHLNQVVIWSHIIEDQVLFGPEVPTLPQCACADGSLPNEPQASHAVQMAKKLPFHDLLSSSSCRLSLRLLVATIYQHTDTAFAAIVSRSMQ